MYFRITKNLAGNQIGLASLLPGMVTGSCGQDAKTEKTLCQKEKKATAAPLQDPGVREACLRCS